MSGNESIPEIRWARSYFVIGITGGLGSGKSMVSRLFESLGHFRMDADIVARDVLFSDELREPLLDNFGEGILDEGGAISRENIASLVFQNPEKLEILNGLIHPAVRRRFDETVSRLQPGEILIYDVPLLFEAGLEDNFDLTITVSASREIRMERVAIRNQWPKEEFLRREASQMPLEEKEKRADLVIMNQDSEENLREKVVNINEAILGAAPSG